MLTFPERLIYERMSFPRSGDVPAMAFTLFDVTTLPGRCEWQEP